MLRVISKESKKKKRLKIYIYFVHMSIHVQWRIWLSRISSISATFKLIISITVAGLQFIIWKFNDISSLSTTVRIGEILKVGVLWNQGLFLTWHELKKRFFVCDLPISVGSGFGSGGAVGKPEEKRFWWNLKENEKCHHAAGCFHKAYSLCSFTSFTMKRKEKKLSVNIICVPRCDK